MLQTAADVPIEFRAFLELDHRRLDFAFSALLAAFATADPAPLRETWSSFDLAINGHFVAEETYMLPLFRVRHREEADALRDEHVRFRELLAALGVGVDLRLVRLDVARALVETLRAHASREEHLLYAWAEQELGAPTKRNVVDHVRASGPGHP